MPIVIEELSITTNVDQAGAGSGEGAPQGGGSGPEEKKKLMKECVDQIMELLRSKKER